ncbi:MAG: M67 family metallopeptidase [Capsulimonadaceae bacterium]|nr:M67 family metallopeptidase [Capsulimonadaceae bacterium]
MASHLTLSIPDALERTMLEHCVAAYPREACGALLGALEAGARRVEEVIALENAAPPDRMDRFEVRPADMLRLMRCERGTERRLIGFYHSHPDHPAHPSATDLAAAWPEYSYAIVSVRNGVVAEWTSWRLASEGARYDSEGIQILG